MAGVTGARILHPKLTKTRVGLKDKLATQKSILHTNIYTNQQTMHGQQQNIKH